MRIFSVSFSKIVDGRKAVTGAEVIVEDDVEISEIMKHFEKTAEFGWKIDSVACKDYAVRIQQLYPREY